MTGAVTADLVSAVIADVACTCGAQGARSATFAIAHGERCPRSVSPAALAAILVAAQPHLAAAERDRIRRFSAALGEGGGSDDEVMALIQQLLDDGAAAERERLRALVPGILACCDGFDAVAADLLRPQPVGADAEPGDLYGPPPDGGDGEDG